MWISHRKEIRKLTFRALALRRSESRTCTSVLKWPPGDTVKQIQLSDQSGTPTRKSDALITRHAAYCGSIFWSTARYWLTHGQKHTQTKWCLPCFTRVRPYCSIGVCDFPIQARALTLFHAHATIQPLALRTVASISAGRVALGFVAVNISARQGTGRATLVVLESSRTLQSYETKAVHLKCSLSS